MAKILEKFRSDDSQPVAGENPVTEDELDQTLEDSFPASDPPSHTPTTSLGGPTHQVDSSGQVRRLPPGWAIAAGGVALLAILFAIGRKVRS